MGKYYVILPQVTTFDLDSYLKKNGGKKVKIGFSYNSGENDEWVGVEELRKLIVEHVDPNFKP